MIVDREFSGDPGRMTYSSCGMTGGGQQTPGFIGIRTLYICPRSSLSAMAAGALVWTTTRVKQKLATTAAAVRRKSGSRKLSGQDRAMRPSAPDCEPLIEHLEPSSIPRWRIG